MVGDEKKEKGALERGRPLSHPLVLSTNAHAAGPASAPSTTHKRYYY